MDIKVNQKIIKEMCGTVSFKRGDSFYRANKVTFKNYTFEKCEAIVTAGTEDFIVTVETNGGGNFYTKCSCPKLASFQKDCQHIAAVLLAINEKQRIGKVPSLNSNQELTDGLMTLFQDQPTRSSGHQLHFENRQILKVEFMIKPISIEKGQHMLGIELKVGPTKVQNIRGFLKQIRAGKPSVLSLTFTYNQNLQCFDKETDAVIQELIQVVLDENAYRDWITESVGKQLLLIPPSAWERVLSKLRNVPLVKVEYIDRTFEGVHFSDELLPLQFNFTESEEKAYYLKIKGLHTMIVLNSYQSVLHDGRFIKLESKDCKRLSDLKQMLDASGTNKIPIPQERLEFFLEKIAPGLKKLGDVHISDTISEQFMKTPLIAKLYLDRVSNRLLAGLEFHYEHLVINPLESRDLPSGSMLIRDVEKEEEVLQLMEGSDFAKTDGGYFLHNEELEYQFLSHTVPKLHKLVQVYATTAVRNRLFRGKTGPRISVKVKKERTNWLEFKFEMDGIPEKQIREVLLALEEKRKYYRMQNGTLLSLETKEMEEIQRFLQAVPGNNEDLVLGKDVSMLDSLKLLDSVEGSQAFMLEDSFRQFLENIRHPGSLEFLVPKGLELTLRDYQIRGYKWMKTLASFGFGGILADDMGLGKTLQSITFIASVLTEIRHAKRPALIVCPSSLTYNWLSEIMKFSSGLQAIVVDGNKMGREEVLKDIEDVDVLITSYPLLRRDIKSYEKMEFHTVFFDEAQAFKNPVTQTARAVKKIQADHRFALTGTPVENSLEELWSIFHVVFPELFLGLKEYSQLSRKAISRRIRPFLLRRMKEDVLSELPEKMEAVESVELLPEQKQLYGAYLAKLRHDTFKHLDKDTIRKNRIKILAGLTRLRQICCHPSLFVDGYKGNSAKFQQLLQIVEESKLSGRRVLIFSQFTKMLDLIGRELAAKGMSFFYLDGQTPSEDRVTICDRFNEGERDFFLISLKAGGTGLNLTGADTVILYDTWWNPAVEEQAADRVHRIGQTNVVQVIKLVARGTIEEKMNELQDKKRDLVQEIIEEKASSGLSEEDIREILSV